MSSLRLTYEKREEKRTFIIRRKKGCYDKLMSDCTTLAEGLVVGFF
jgi:hypothetical protein